MKVLLITGSINQGGAEFQLLTLARLLQERGFEVEVLALTDYDYFKPYILKHKLQYACIENKGSNLYRVWKAVKYIVKSKPHLVISYIKKVSQLAILARICSGFSFKLITSERTALLRPRHDLFYFNLTRLANFITVNSVAKLNYIRRRFPFLARKAVFMPNIIDVGLYASLQTLPSAEGITRLSFVGRIAPEKNLLNLVKAVGLLHKKGYPLRLSLTGSAHSKNYLESLYTLIREEQLESVVVFTGAVKNVDEVYRQTDLLCLVSFFEGFSNVLSEALSCGIPVLASNIEENQFLISEGMNGFLVPPADVNAIAAGIERFLKLDNASKRAISYNNRIKAHDLFDEETVYQKYLELFRKMKLY